MISSFEIDVDVLSDMMGIVVEKKNPAPSEGESLQLFIPILMSELHRSIPTKSTNFINKGVKLFLNASDCRPTCRTLLKTQNYITGYMEKNSEWINSSTSEVKSRQLENTDGYRINATGVDSYGASIHVELNEMYKTYYTVGGEKVECYAPNGKFSKLLINNDKYL